MRAYRWTRSEIEKAGQSREKPTKNPEASKLASGFFVGFPLRYLLHFPSIGAI
jgi:hypothetical protein